MKLCLKKFREGGIDSALYDKPRSGHPVEITDDAVAWMIDIACQRPADLGYSQELWTLKNLHQHIQKERCGSRFPAACNDYKVYGPKNIAQIRDQAI